MMPYLVPKRIQREPAPIPAIPTEDFDPQLTDEQKIVLAAVGIAPHTSSYIHAQCPNLGIQKVRKALKELRDLRLIHHSPHRPKYLLSYKGEQVQRAIKADTLFWIEQAQKGGKHL